VARGGKRISAKHERAGEQLKSRWKNDTLRRTAVGLWKCAALFALEAPMIDITLTPEQEAQAQRLAAIIGKKAEEEALQMARILASKSDAQLLGATEFQIRERGHKIVAHAIETALNERKKGGIKGPA
jgi:hypothetical protein